MATPTTLPGAILELPTQHRIPLSWLLAHGGESIRYRTLRELAPPAYATPAALAEAQQAIAESKSAVALVKRQKDTGVWGGNLLALAPSVKDGIKEVGTIPHYRRLLQIAYPRDTRPYRLAERVLYRLLSRDEDPALLFEYQKLLKTEPDANGYVREMLREASCAALAEAGHVEDPRVRGAAHKIANAVSQFLRSPLAEKPFVKGAKTLALHAEAHPPTWYSVAMISAMPNLRRERAGFTERLGHYLAQPAPKKDFVVTIGKKSLKPEHLLLGDPIDADAKGVAKDIPLALHYIELLARMGALQWAPVATKVLGRLLKDCNAEGVWTPKNLRSVPKATHRITWHYFPICPDDKHLEGREVDVTFRLATIAKLLGWEIEYV